MSVLPPTAGDPLIGRRIGPYDVEMLLGRGGMGRVYRAAEPALGRVVALKVIHDSLAGDESFVKRFIREARAAAKISHPNVAHVYGLVENGPAPVLVMEYVRGRPLNEILKETPRLEPRRALGIAMQVASALGAAHALGIVHRDIKPHNVMIDPEGRAVVMDFGLARLADGSDSLTSTGLTMGTVHYMSPEQARGDTRIDGRADFFSLGAMLYQMLAGHLPFLGESAQSVMRAINLEPPATMPPIAPDLDAPVARLLGRMLEKDPEKRHGSAAELIEEIRSMLGARDATPPGASATPAGTRRGTARDAVATRTPTPRAAPAGRVEGVVDMFWAAADWFVGVKDRTKAEGEAAAEARRRKGIATRGDDPLAPVMPDGPGGQTAATLPAGISLADSDAVTGQTEALGGSDGSVSGGRGAGNPLSRLRDSLRARMTERSRRRAERRAAGPPRMKCPECGAEQPPPAVFCASCHEPFVHVNKPYMIVMLSVGMTCFFAAEYFREGMAWPWPLFAFFALAFLSMNSAVLRGATRARTTTFLWGVVFMLAGFLSFLFGMEDAREFAVTALRTFGSILAEQPIAAGVAGGGFLLAGVILVVAMSFKYTVTHAYRILILLAVAAAIALERAWPRLDEFESFRRATDFTDPDAAVRALELGWVNMLRALAAELVVYSLVVAHRSATEAFAARRIRPKAAGARKGPKSPLDPLVDTLYGLSIAFANAFTRFSIQIVQTTLALGRTLRDLAIRLADFCWVLTRDLVAPAASLVGAAVAIERLSVATGHYVRSHAPADLAPVAAWTGAIFACQVVFLASKGRVHVGRLLSSGLFLGLWSAPYALILFVLSSASLWAVGRVLLRFDGDLDYQYRIGAATWGAVGLTVIALGFAVLRRHGQTEDAGAEEAGAVDHPEGGGSNPAAGSAGSEER